LGQNRTRISCQSHRTDVDVIFSLPSDQSVELDVESLLRGSLKERTESYNIGVTKDIFAPNEIRKRGGFAPVIGGDEPRVQSQMIPLSAPVSAPATTTPAPDDDAKAEVDNLLRKIMERLHDD
jgi:hypothetical protein